MYPMRDRSAPQRSGDHRRESPGPTDDRAQGLRQKVEDAAEPTRMAWPGCDRTGQAGLHAARLPVYRDFPFGGFPPPSARLLLAAVHQVEGDVDDHILLPADHPPLAQLHED